MDHLPQASREYLTFVIALPNFDMTSSTKLDELQRQLKDEFVPQGLMIGQFHPQCPQPGLWNPQFRPLQSPIPLLALRRMVASDLPFLVGSCAHASSYLTNFAREIPPHTRNFMLQLMVPSQRQSTDRDE
jgi:hypothetical protein